MDLVTLALSKKYTEDSLLGAGALKGKDGKSAYEIALANGFKGTEKEWVASLKGNDIANISGILWFGGFISAQGTYKAESLNDRKCTNFIPCGENVTVKFVGETNHTNISALTFYDANKAVLQTNVNVATDVAAECTAVSPVGTRFVRLSYRPAVSDVFLLRIEGKTFLESAFDTLNKKVNEQTQNANELAEKTDKMAKDTAISAVLWLPGFISAKGKYKYESINSRKCTRFIPCGENKAVSFIGETNSAGVSALTFYDADKAVLATNSNVTTNMTTEFTATSPVGTKYVRLSYNFENSDVFLLRIDGKTIIESAVEPMAKKVDLLSNSVYWVSTAGSDDNDGSIDAPFATVDEALKCGATRVYVLGGVYNQNIDLAKATGQTVEIIKYNSTERVVFKAPDCVIATGETLVSGKVYSVSVTTDKTFAYKNIWLFQDGIADSTTAISAEERHPLQRGYSHRCADTKIVRTTATTLEEAKTEIQNASDYRWYFDSAERTLYFSRPAPITSQNPLCGSFGGNLFNNTKQAMTLTIVGIENKYQVFNIANTVNTQVTDCKSSNVYGEGAFVHNGCVGAAYTRCEAEHAYLGVEEGKTGSGTGDGFNGHLLNLTNNSFAKEVTITMVDCWAHDNNDDGWSDHERCETTIIGGLFEYNKKGGVTPANGCVCTCYNVLARKNNNGFYYTNSASAGRGNGRLICYNCVAESNDTGGMQSNYVARDSGNGVTLINCKSIDSQYGYTVRANARLTLIDCTTLGDKTVIRNYDNTGTVVIKNTVLITG